VIISFSFESNDNEKSINAYEIWAVKYARYLFYFRSHAIACVNQFIIGRAQALMFHIDAFIEVRCSSFYILYISVSTHIVFFLEIQFISVPGDLCFLSSSSSLGMDKCGPLIILSGTK